LLKFLTLTNSACEKKYLNAVKLIVVVALVNLDILRLSKWNLVKYVEQSGG